MGGNLQHVPDDLDDGVTNLHSIWDSVIYSYTGYETLPFDEETWEWYSSESSSIAEAYPIDMDKLKFAQFSQWATESYNMALNAVYDGFLPGEDQTQEYLDRATLQLKTHMMYGGKRLADLLNDIYSDQEEQFLQ